MEGKTFKYILIGLYIVYMLVMLSIFLWGNARMIFFGGIFFPLLIIAQVYYVLRSKGQEDEKEKTFDDWYQNR